MRIRLGSPPHDSKEPANGVPAASSATSQESVPTACALDLTSNGWTLQTTQSGGDVAPNPAQAALRFEQSLRRTSDGHVAVVSGASASMKAVTCALATVLFMTPAVATYAGPRDQGGNSSGRREWTQGAPRPLKTQNGVGENSGVVAQSGDGGEATSASGDSEPVGAVVPTPSEPIKPKPLRWFGRSLTHSYRYEPTFVGDGVRPTLLAASVATLDRLRASAAANAFLSQLVIEGSCALLPDRLVLDVAKAVQFEKGGVAAAFLEHYRQGGGTTKVLDLESVLAANPYARENLAFFVLWEINHSRDAGTHYSRQVEFTYDWRNALGGTRWDFVRSGPNAVTISLRERYAWTPNGDRRTQCIHQAAERLKDEGAQEFDVVGKLTVDLQTLKAWADENGSPEEHELFPH